jgi:branched-chain amino acid transport system substrate-binding protein
MDMMQQGNREIVIGIAGSMSGERTAHADLFRQAEAQLRNLGIRSVLEDDGATPAIALAAAQRLAGQAVTAVIGHFNSACAEAVLPLYRQHHIPLLLPASTKTALSGAGGVFRLCATDHAQAQLMEQTARALGGNPAAIEVAVDGTPYAQRVLQALCEVGLPAAGKPVDILHPPSPGVRLRLILATTPNAMRAHTLLADAGWRGVAMYADDAHVEQFLAHAAGAAVHTLVLGPRSGYGRLMEHACGLIADWRAFGSASLADWLTGSGLFTPSGDAIDADWQLYRADRRVPPSLADTTQESMRQAIAHMEGQLEIS